MGGMARYAMGWRLAYGGAQAHFGGGTTRLNNSRLRRREEDV